MDFLRGIQGSGTMNLKDLLAYFSEQAARNPRREGPWKISHRFLSFEASSSIFPSLAKADLHMIRQRRTILGRERDADGPPDGDNDEIRDNQNNSLSRSLLFSPYLISPRTPPLTLLGKFGLADGGPFRHQHAICYCCSAEK